MESILNGVSSVLVVCCHVTKWPTQLNKLKQHGVIIFQDPGHWLGSSSTPCWLWSSGDLNGLEGIRWLLYIVGSWCWCSWKIRGTVGQITSICHASFHGAWHTGSEGEFPSEQRGREEKLTILWTPGFEAPEFHFTIFCWLNFPHSQPRWRGWETPLPLNSRIHLNKDRRNYWAHPWD